MGLVRGEVLFEVAYYAGCVDMKSVCENTRELAEVIAVELGVKAEDIETKEKAAKDSLIFLGSSCYSSKTGGRLREFITRNGFSGRGVALFGTSGKKKGDEAKAVGELLKPSGALIKGSFYCRRRALPLLHRAHLSDGELANAIGFASKVKESLRK